LISTALFSELKERPLARESFTWGPGLVNSEVEERWLEEDDWNCVIAPPNSQKFTSKTGFLKVLTMEKGNDKHYFYNL
jgi:hypothetical protein